MRSAKSARATSLRGRRHFDEAAGMYVIDIAVNWNKARNERVLANAAHVLDDTQRLVFDRVPLNVLAGARAMTVLGI